MRGFMLLSLVSLALSAPQGYSYAEVQHIPHLEYGPAPPPSPSSTSSITTPDFFKNLQALMALQAANINSNSIDQFLTTQEDQSSTQSLPQQDLLPENFALESNSLSTPYDSKPFPMPMPFSQQQQHQQQQPIISKRFFVHSAPEEDDEEVQHQYITLGKPRKNLNVVFIRAPEKSTQRTLLKISPAPNEERTFIYVLAKKQGIQDIDAHVVEPVTTTAKPEVFFIKYKTPEEAEHAQRTIQSQYDVLGGSTQISNEGVAPLSSVIGALGASQYSAHDEAQYAAEKQVAEDFVNSSQIYQNQQAQSEDGTSTTNNAYLPPTLRRY